MKKQFFKILLEIFFFRITVKLKRFCKFWWLHQKNLITKIPTNVKSLFLDLWVSIFYYFIFYLRVSEPGQSCLTWRCLLLVFVGLFQLKFVVVLMDLCVILVVLMDWGLLSVCCNFRFCSLLFWRIDVMFVMSVLRICCALSKLYSCCGVLGLSESNMALSCVVQ